MAKAVKNTSTKTATKAAKSFKINLQKPGNAPEVISVKAETTVADFVNDMNLDGYVISLNGSTVNASSTQKLTKDDILRVGIKTKNNL
ncbi:MAG: hypothetical protein ACYC2U_04630 [Candidatus Amoebophilus sp.]